MKKGIIGIMSIICMGSHIFPFYELLVHIVSLFYNEY